MKQKADTRHRWMRPLAGAMMAAVCLVLMISTPAGAVFDPYPIGWYDTVGTGVDMLPLQVANTNVPGGQGTTVIVAYSPGSIAVTTDYLDMAQAAGVKVMLGNNLTDNNLYFTDTEGIIDHVDQYDYHPAVAGWYLGDEPFSNLGATILPDVQVAYNAIKSVSSKPVLICWGEPAYIAGIPETWSSTYDIAMPDAYSCKSGYPEFTMLGREDYDEYPGWDDFKGFIDMAQEQSVAAGKPYWAAVQGWGQGEYRLPTNAESKFHTFYPILKEAAGIVYFSHYRGSTTRARPAEAYPYCGWTWIDDVITSRNDEVNLLGPSIREGSIGSNAFSSDNADVIGDVYRDPGTGIFYIITANTELYYGAPTITLDLQGLPPETPVSVRPLFEGDVPPIPLSAGGTQFTDAFFSYGIHLYQVMYEPADCTEAIADGYGYGFVGDLNDDCDSDIDDLVMFVNAWLDCIEPDVSGCRTPWEP